MKHKQYIGKRGEDIAVEYLKKERFTVVDRNFKCRYEEIDIVAVKDKVLVFIEVKTRTTAEYGTPLESITPWKLRSLEKAAQYYSLLHPKLPSQLRIDAIAIELSQSNEVVHIEYSTNISGF